MGMRSGEVARSERMMIAMFRFTASSTSPQSSSMRALSPSFPAAASQVQSRTCEGNPWSAMWVIFSSWCSKRMAESREIELQCPGLSSSRFRSGPSPAPRVITAHSRMGSMGGLVTWAKRCLK